MGRSGTVGVAGLGGLYVVKRVKVDEQTTVRILTDVMGQIYEVASSSSGVGNGRGTAAGDIATMAGDPGERGPGDTESGRRIPVKAFS